MALTLTLCVPQTIFAADSSSISGDAGAWAQVEPSLQMPTGESAQPQSDDSAQPASSSQDEEAAAPVQPEQPAQPQQPTQPTQPAQPQQPTNPGKATPKYTKTYRIEKNGSQLRCYWYDAAGEKTLQKDKYFIVKFDKGSKTEGTAVKPVGKSGTMYYFDAKGKGGKYTGWYKQKKKSYYFQKGTRLKGTKKAKGIWYKFSKKDGHKTRRIGDDIDKKFQSQSSSTRYLIVVKLKEHKVRIYKGKKNKWKRIHTYKCTVGKAQTPTITGTFTIGSRGQYFDTGTNLRCWYYTQFRGNYLFHSVLYDRSSSPVHVMDGRLGINASHGCIRLALANAKWINRHIPSATKVIVY